MPSHRPMASHGMDNETQKMTLSKEHRGCPGHLSSPNTHDRSPDYRVECEGSGFTFTSGLRVITVLSFVNLSMLETTKIVSFL